MNEFLLIESSGPQLAADAERFVGDACCLLREGADVALLLIEDGVVGAVSPLTPGVETYLRLGGELWADDFSLHQRGVAPEDMADGARAVDMAAVAERLLRANVRAVWH
ncbi:MULTISPECIES: hypothetical protein [unclassified Streptomyces]|uniref:hypothetical protein n=1 Tax=unclassified Streptomyces TaxID=2593676 RepID=UPI002DDB2CAB|nr:MULTISPECIES: hypothetical protein [unclassified Streptomyces]WSA90504.1 hypothetical protein OIE63_02345 [Streptomyces sp. NBC_01795]WSS16888.1 hypothetical protein OG533_37065 [Streptomyces sp. NBC_01186]WSS45631.1 hypothetical protein OG220_37310 [Streptomyces sp. NBC_01187]